MRKSIVMSIIAGLATMAGFGHNEIPNPAKKKKLVYGGRKVLRSKGKREKSLRECSNRSKRKGGK